MILFYDSVGLVSLEMPLSSDPVLGEWKITANDGHKDTTEPFKVDKYGKLGFYSQLVKPTAAFYILHKKKMLSLKCAGGPVVSTPRLWITRSRVRIPLEVNSAHDCMALHCKEPFHYHPFFVS